MPSSTGTKRLALATVLAFYGLNGRRLTPTNDQAYDLVMAVVGAQLDTVDDIAAVLQPAAQPRDLLAGHSGENRLSVMPAVRHCSQRDRRAEVP
jgi:hypothetical protein